MFYYVKSDLLKNNFFFKKFFNKKFNLNLTFKKKYSIFFFFFNKLNKFEELDNVFFFFLKKKINVTVLYFFFKKINKVNLKHYKFKNFIFFKKNNKVMILNSNLNSFWVNCRKKYDVITTARLNYSIFFSKNYENAFQKLKKPKKIFSFEKSSDLHKKKIEKLTQLKNKMNDNTKTSLKNKKILKLDELNFLNIKNIKWNLYEWKILNFYNINWKAVLYPESIYELKDLYEKKKKKILKNVKNKLNKKFFYIFFKITNLKFKKNNFFFKNKTNIIKNFIKNKVNDVIYVYNVNRAKINLNFLRKNKIFNKGRYSRNRQLYRTGVYWCLYLNIIIVLALQLWFLKFYIKFSFVWFLFYFTVFVFFFSRFLSHKFYFFNFFSDLNWYLKLFLKLFFNFFSFKKIENKVLNYVTSNYAIFNPSIVINFNLTDNNVIGLYFYEKNKLKIKNKKKPFKYVALDFDNFLYENKNNFFFYNNDIIFIFSPFFDNYANKKSINIINFFNLFNASLFKFFTIFYKIIRFYFYK